MGDSFVGAPSRADEKITLLMRNSDPQNTDQHVKQTDQNRTEYGFILEFWPLAIV